MASDNYTITGLLSNTKYFIVLTPYGQDQCAALAGASYSAISEALTSGEVNHVYLLLCNSQTKQPTILNTTHVIVKKIFGLTIK